MTETSPHTRHSARIASLVPGRLRIKFRKTVQAPEAMHRLKSRLETREGIHQVKVNPVSGSVTIHYDDKRHGTAGVLGLLEDVDVMVESIGHLPSIDGGKAASTEGFFGAMEDVNRRFRAWTGMPVDVKVLLPLLFLAAGIWSTFRKGLMVESVPGWLFIWFAFDMFVKLHPPHRGRGRTPVE